MFRTVVKGMDRLQRAFQQRTKVYFRRLDKGVEAAMGVLDAEIYKIIPIDEGNLWGNHKKGKVGSNALRPTVQYVIRFFANYAVYVHENPPDRQLHGLMYNIRYAKEIRRGQIDPKTKRPYRLRRPQEQWKYVQAPLYDPVVQKKMLSAANRVLMSTRVGRSRVYKPPASRTATGTPDIPTGYIPTGYNVESRAIVNPIEPVEPTTIQTFLETLKGQPFFRKMTTEQQAAAIQKAIEGYGRLGGEAP